MTGNKTARKMNVRESSDKKMSCQADVISGTCVQEYELEPDLY